MWIELGLAMFIGSSILDWNNEEVIYYLGEDEVEYELDEDEPYYE